MTEKVYDFGEKTSKKDKGVEKKILQSKRYQGSKKKAIELIENGKYGLSEEDFWILEKPYGDYSIVYNGLIISHAGVQKINDCLPAAQKFNPRCAGEPYQSPYTGGLVITYIDDEIRVSAEVSKDNCKQKYPYAMLDKRLFDRVVLLKSKIAFDGIYSEEESDDFQQDMADQRFNVETGELIVSDESLPIKKVGQPKGNNRKTAQPKKEPEKKPATVVTPEPAPARQLMSLDQALDFETPSKSGAKMVSMRTMIQKAISEEDQKKFVEFLKKNVKSEKGPLQEASLVIIRGIQSKEVTFTTV